MPADLIRTLLLGDVYGDPGCRVIFLKLKNLIKNTKADYVVVNGENACRGFGLSIENMNLLFDNGCDVITSGNHIWEQEEIIPFLDSNDRILRPANYGNLVCGHGMTVVGDICVINLQGRLNMFPIEDPFKWASDLVRKSPVKNIFVDFHAESSEEKEALGMFLDGKVTAVVGTHIHVQTADERILPNRTAYITDLGMCGPKGSIIGSDPSCSIKKQLTQLPLKVQVYDAPAEIHGVLVVSEKDTGKAVSIERLVF